MEGNRLRLTQDSTAKFCLESLKRRDITSGVSVTLRDYEAVSMSFARYIRGEFGVSDVSFSVSQSTEPPAEYAAFLHDKGDII
jgi:hypothetical protein